MTEGEYKASLRALGMTPYMPSYEGATIYVDRHGDTHSIADANTLTPEEREIYLTILENIIGQ